MAATKTKRKAKTMLAYHGDSKIKARYVRRMEGHRKADELVQGCTWESNGHQRGCAVGCCFHNYDHSRGPIEIGVPEVLVRLEDYIFEGLPLAEAKKWPSRFLKAIPVGADLSVVWPQFAVWLLIDKKHGVILFAGGRDDVRKAIEQTAALWQRVVDGESAESLKEEFAAAYAAADAAAYAAYAAYAAAYAAYAAADAAARAAYAARAAADAARAAAYAAYAARHVHWRACADKIIELLEATAV
jgi:hypothetical protein